MSEPMRPKASARGATPAPACTLVIFGVTGDLTSRLLMPALYNLSRWGLLSDGFSILGIGRSGIGAEGLRKELDSAIRSFVAESGRDFDEAAWSRVVACLDYLRGDVTDPALYREIGARLAGRPALFYLAVASTLFGPIVQKLGEAGLAREEGDAWRRVVIEKPFGHDLASAQALNREVLAVLREDQVFRMDHFLGKETVQNILAFRFGNGIFEPLWNRDRIDHVQISVAEAVGVERRGIFYDATGALRDMVPNHLFQLFTLIAMEPPISFAADDVRDRKEDVLSAIRPLDREAAVANAVRAQYGPGEVLGRPVVDYRQEPDVSPASTTETYAAMRLDIDNWRWAGVPFYLRTGKSMTRRTTEIAIAFREAPLALFRDTAVEAPAANWLVLQIQPDEGISLEFGAKVPGPQVKLGRVQMGFKYRDHFRVDPSTGYETLIYDAMTGDATLYQRADNIEAGWRVVQPILEAWSEVAAPMARYAAGSEGPAEADRLLARDGRAWRRLS